MTSPDQSLEGDKLKNDIAVQVLEAMAQATYGTGFLLLDEKQRQYLVVDAGDTCKNLLALFHQYSDRAVLEARKEELEQFEPLQREHENCIDPMSCIGYQNAANDFDNEKQLRLEELRK